ncbi:MAG: MBOAT family protein [Candidatus Hydrogenedentes bacterium]|nr:MBOAT family protein [Candidatus Hydrogenedentota bacterium]
MLFNSIHFVFFFPIVVCAYFAMPFRFRWILLLAASYYFYMCWQVNYLLLIIVSTLIDYVAGLLMGRTEDRKRRRLYLLLSLCTNLGLLFSFKYFNFFNETLRGFLDFYGVPYHIPALKVLLPVGISFYTFQTLSYTIDVYRGVREPERHLGYFAVYVAFFPQLVAGPIERSTNLLPQFFKKHGIDRDRIRSGLLLMGCGFFKKVVIADRLAAYVDAIYEHPDAYHGLPVLLAFYFFAIQVYCDFSGYSDIAIGAARVMGYDLMTNFRRPHFSKDMRDVWTRWHISLSTWMRDYLYIPLGGNRVAPWRRHVNLFTVFLLSGLWHGANWTYVAWGGLHGVFLVAGNLTRAARRRITDRIFPGRAAILHTWLQVLIVFHLWTFATIFFRANMIGDVFVLLSTACQDFSLWDPKVFGPMNPVELGVGLACVALLHGVELVQELTTRPLEERFVRLPVAARWAFYYLLIFSILVLGNFQENEFVYFQF